jgi:hypothetical protein
VPGTLAPITTTTTTTVTTTTTTTTTTTRPDFGAINSLPTVPPSGGMPTSTTTTTTQNCIVGDKVAVPGECQKYKRCIEKDGTWLNLTCATGTAFDMDKKICTDPTKVAGCEDYAPDCETGNTGGTCVADLLTRSNCAKWRGETTCINGICHCEVGWCAIPEDSPGVQAGTCIWGLEASQPALIGDECFTKKTDKKCKQSSDCEPWRGPTECQDGICVCRFDTCGTKDGRCLHNPKAEANSLLFF